MTSNQAKWNVQTTVEWAGMAAMFVCAVAVTWIALDLRQTAQAQVGSSGPVPLEPVALEGATLVGSGTARGAMIVFADFECPSCGQFARNALESIRRDYIDHGRLLLAFRQFPLDGHPHARSAASAAACAGEQHHFWEMHDALFDDQRHLDEASLRSKAASIGLDHAAFARCFEAEPSPKIDADLALGVALQVKATPTFLFGKLLPDMTVKVTDRLQGDRPLTDYVNAIDRATRR